MAETTRRVLHAHPTAEVAGLDVSAAMLDHARADVPHGRFIVGRLEDTLPAGPFDLVISALAIHHLDGAGKADLFARVAAILRTGGRFVLADLIVPEQPDDVVTDIDGVHDTPSPLPDQQRWLAEAGFTTDVAWRHRDLAVVVADLPAG